MLRFLLPLLPLIACDNSKEPDLGPATTPTTIDYDPDSPLTASEIVTVSIDENVLSNRVRVNTSKSATAEVRFGPSGEDYPWKVTGDAATEHDLLVIGMRAETDYEFLVVLTADDDGEVIELEPITWTSGRPPSHVAKADVLIHDPTQAADGWTLMDLNNPEAGVATVAMFDMEGYPVWYHVLPDHNVNALDVSLTWRNTILAGGSVDKGERPMEISLDGSYRWAGPEQRGYSSNGYMHHHIELLASGNYLTLEKVFVDGVRGDVIREMTPDLSSAWSWNAFDWLDPNWDDPDWTHSNWVHISDDGFVYLSVRHESAIYKIDYGTGEVLWRLGEGGDFALTAGEWFYEQHAPSVLEGGGKILVYDNAGDNGVARVVEYALDEQAMTAEQVWVYGGDNEEGWLSDYWGDADRLSNGNTLITAGANDVNSVFEVSADGELVWWLQHANDGGDDDTSMYRSERITPPLVEPL